MIQDVVVNLGGGGAHDSTAAFALSLAKAFDAHTAGVAFVYEPVIPGSLLGGIPTDLIEVQREENAKAAKAAVDHFEAAAKTAGVAFETRLLDASIAGASDLFGRIARRFDMAVVGQADPSQGVSEELLIEGALFGSGRPVIIVPQAAPAATMKLDHVMVCWDGSRPAARAIGDAIPLLRRAKAVQIVVVTGERDKSGEITGTNMKRHLGRHGIAVDIHRIAGNVEAQTAILAHAKDSGADFLVMGGYGHSRLREFILGGVTRSILKAMPVPVLMSH